MDNIHICWVLVLVICIVARGLCQETNSNESSPPPGAIIFGPGDWVLADPEPENAANGGQQVSSDPEGPEPIPEAEEGGGGGESLTGPAFNSDLRMTLDAMMNRLDVLPDMYDKVGTTNKRVGRMEDDVDRVRSTQNSIQRAQRSMQRLYTDMRNRIQQMEEGMQDMQMTMDSLMWTRIM